MGKYIYVEKKLERKGEQGKHLKWKEGKKSNKHIENRIYREELKEFLGMNFVSPFQPEREFKVYKSCKCSQIICSRVH